MILCYSPFYGGLLYYVKIVEIFVFNVYHIWCFYGLQDSGTSKGQKCEINGKMWPGTAVQNSLNQEVLEWIY